MLRRICCIFRPVLTLGRISLGICTSHSQIWEQSRRLPAECCFSAGDISVSREERKMLGRQRSRAGEVMAVFSVLRSSVESQLQKVWGLLAWWF